jgi:hypothetical protein
VKFNQLSGDGFGQAELVQAVIHLLPEFRQPGIGAASRRVFLLAVIKSGTGKENRVIDVKTDDSRRLSFQTLGELIKSDPLPGVHIGLSAAAGQKKCGDKKNKNTSFVH